ncbi:hypothetical protein WMF41_23125 [Sorangium sp. So ce1151]
MRKLTYGMSLSLDGYIAAPGDDIGWSVPSDELFGWWTDRMREVGLSLYGRKLWETMSAYWSTAHQQPGASPARMGSTERIPSWRLISRLFNVIDALGCQQDAAIAVR